MLFITHALLVVGACPQPVPVQYSKVKPGKVVAAYFANWGLKKYGYKVCDIEPIAHKLTHVIYAFAKPNSNTGTCELSDPLADLEANLQHRKKVGGHFGELLKLKQKYPHLKILLSIGGGTCNKSFLEIAKQGKTQTFVKSVVKLLDSYEYEYEHSDHGSAHTHKFEYAGLFEGVDLDWEWDGVTISNDQVAMYHTMLEMLSSEMKKRSALQGKKSLLTCAISVNPKLIKSLKLGSVAKLVDWFHVMAYDFGGSTASSVSFNAPICNPWSEYSIDSSLTLLMNTGVSPAKIVLGIPLYGQVFDQAQEGVGSSFSKSGKTGAFRYVKIKELYLNNPDCQSKWDSKSLAAYAYCPTDEVFVSYDDARSVNFKADYARKKLLKGIFFWQLSGDDKDHSLIKAVKV